MALLQYSDPWSSTFSVRLQNGCFAKTRRLRLKKEGMACLIGVPLWANVKMQMPPEVS